jgi:hypothetical protein
MLAYQSSNTLQIFLAITSGQFIELSKTGLEVPIYLDKPREIRSRGLKPS